MKPKKIENCDELRNNIDNFVEGFETKPELTRDLFRRGRCWVYSPEREVFGPVKFVGFKDMDIDRYKWLRENAPQSDSIDFDGRKAKRAIETVLNDKFEESNELKECLIKWGKDLYVPNFFEQITTEKWEFISVE